MCKKTCKCNLILAAIFIGIALTLSAIVICQGGNGGSPYLKFVASVMPAFEVMIPVLAVGALVKYLLCGGKKRSCECSNGSVDQGCGVKVDNK